jgi:hypothetical protein
MRTSWLKYRMRSAKGIVTLGVPGFLPYQLLRGVDRDIPSVELPTQVVYTRDDVPDDLAYLVAKLLDEKPIMLR